METTELKRQSEWESRNFHVERFCGKISPIKSGRYLLDNIGK
jgi:hypothetical protein